MGNQINQTKKQEEGFQNQHLTSLRTYDDYKRKIFSWPEAASLTRIIREDDEMRESNTADASYRTAYLVVAIIIMALAVIILLVIFVTIICRKGIEDRRNNSSDESLLSTRSRPRTRLERANMRQACCPVTRV